MARRYLKNHKKIIIPCLNYKIRLAGATNMSLEEASGVSHVTIQRARNGVGILLTHGLTILEALRPREFSRDKRGNGNQYGFAEGER